MLSSEAVAGPEAEDPSPALGTQYSALRTQHPALSTHNIAPFGVAGAYSRLNHEEHY